MGGEALGGVGSDREAAEEEARDGDLAATGEELRRGVVPGQGCGSVRGAGLAREKTERGRGLFAKSRPRWHLTGGPEAPRRQAARARASKGPGMNHL